MGSWDAFKMWHINKILWCLNSEAGRLINNQQCPLLPCIQFVSKNNFKRGWVRVKSVWKIWSTAFHSGLTLRLHFYARAAADMHFYITTRPLGLPVSLGVVSFPSTLALEGEFQEQVGWGNWLGWLVGLWVGGGWGTWDNADIPADKTWCGTAHHFRERDGQLKRISLRSGGAQCSSLTTSSRTI